MGSLALGGVLAVQMPDNSNEPANALQREVAANGPWAKDLTEAVPRSDLLSADAYYDLLKPVCTRIDIWHTIYNFVMASPLAIVEWFKGSSLQPYLNLLDDDAREKFLAAYSERVTGAYKPRVDGAVLLKFPRLFIVATR
jgi:trans-aconitate 2-methyltransferase